MIKFEDCRLGETDEALAIDTSEQLGQVSLEMVRQRKRMLDIISRELDPAIYNTAEFTEAVKQLVLKSRNNRVRILVHEPLRIAKRGHRLVDLAMHLSSFIWSPHARARSILAGCRNLIYKVCRPPSLANWVNGYR